MSESKTEPTEGKAGYDIDVIETAKSKIPQRKCAKDQIMPKFPFSMMITGSSGSGKTNLMINIMTKPSLYGKYFHRIAIFSPTAGSADDMYKKLGKIPKENFISTMTPAHIESVIEHRARVALMPRRPFALLNVGVLDRHPLVDLPERVGHRGNPV